jgi:hypothetical protein
MLRACVLNYPDKWDKCLPLAEFSYNNSFQESQDGAFQSFVWSSLSYPCELDRAWREDDRLDLVFEAKEIVHRIQSNLKAAKA